MRLKSSQQIPFFAAIFLQFFQHFDPSSRVVSWGSWSCCGLRNCRTSWTARTTPPSAGRRFPSCAAEPIGADGRNELSPMGCWRKQWWRVVYVYTTSFILYYWYTWNEMLYRNQVTLKRCRKNWIDQSFRIGTRNFFASFFLGRYNHSILSFQESLIILILMVYIYIIYNFDWWFHFSCWNTYVLC